MFNQMTILGINSSPHSDGNTAYALRYCLNRIESNEIKTAYIWIGDKTIQACDGCFKCRETGKCIHDDDMTEIYDAVRNCDGLILASPVYLGLVNGPMKTMMDRTVALRRGQQFDLSGKIGAGIACGGFRNGGQELTLQSMHTFFLQQDMLVIADGPRFSHSGAAIVGNASEDQIGLQTVTNLAERMVQALTRIARP